MLETYEQNSRKKLVATILAIIVIAGAVVIADHLKTKNTITTSSVSQTNSATTDPISTTSNNLPLDTTTTTTDTSSSTATSSSNTSNYKDGTYTAASEYFVPHGNESIQVNLTLSDGVITAVSVKNSEGDRDSMLYQEDFTSGYKTYVVGHKISGLKIGTVAGASDTSQAFNEALSQIASKAQA